MHVVLLLFLCSHFSFAFDWQGHRGARGLMPENTIEAMKEAMKYPVTTLELDVVISKDSKVVVSHEPWMHEEICTPGGKQFNLYKMTYEEIIKVDCGSKIHPRFPEQKKIVVGKPLLSLLIMETKDRGLHYNVEIKSTPEEEKEGYQPDIKVFCDLVVKELLDHLPATHFTLQSFDWRVLKYLNANYPQITLSALSEELMEPDVVIKNLGFTPQIWSPYYKKLDSKHVQSFHDLKMKVIPWTVNTVAEMVDLQKLKVDGIITDYPNLIPKLLKTCKRKLHLFENRCVKVPTHALPSEHNPGWVCKAGYQQWRKGCRQIKLPKDAHFLEDAKTWACDVGYERYRGSCKKK